MLEQLLGSVPLTDFLNETTIASPYVGRGGCRHLRDLGSWETFDAVIRRLDRGKLTVSCNGGDDVPFSTQMPSRGAEARALIVVGYSVEAAGANEVHEGLHQLARAFADDVGCSAFVEVIATAAGQSATSWHIDHEDVYSLQTVGTKEWLLRENPDYPACRVRPDADGPQEDAVPPVQRVVLEAGDWLYCPMGCWHETRAIEDSLALTVSVIPPRRIDVIQSLGPFLADSPRWHRTLEPSVPLDRLRVLCSGLTDELIAILTGDGFARSWASRWGKPNSFQARSDKDGQRSVYMPSPTALCNGRSGSGGVQPYDALFQLDEELAWSPGWLRHVLPVPGAACPVSADHRRRLHQELFVTLGHDLKRLMRNDDYIVDCLAERLSMPQINPALGQNGSQ